MGFFGTDVFLIMSKGLFLSPCQELRWTEYCYNNQRNHWTWNWFSLTGMVKFHNSHDCNRLLKISTWNRKKMPMLAKISAQIIPWVQWRQTEIAMSKLRLINISVKIFHSTEIIPDLTGNNFTMNLILRHLKKFLFIRTNDVLITPLETHNPI